ncbi:hypothetical protein [Caldibacillus debilis]|uniref:hypothetical protein n=1 Tax=Caldibacillus debilis TaxID=301148 RepID=UPI0023F4ACD3|nr:hypothetical protein [Caldibacillus debilis]
MEFFALPRCHPRLVSPEWFAAGVFLGCSGETGQRQRQGQDVFSRRSGFRRQASDTGSTNARHFPFISREPGRRAQKPARKGESDFFRQNDSFPPYGGKTMHPNENAYKL